MPMDKLSPVTVKTCPQKSTVSPNEVCSPPLDLTYRYPSLEECPEVARSDSLPPARTLSGGYILHLNSQTIAVPPSNDRAVSFSVSSDKRTPEMRDEYLTIHPLNISLATDFESHLRNTSFTEIAEPTGEKPISHPDRFRLVPVIGSESLRSTICAAEFSVNAPRDVHMTYSGSRSGRPYLDTRQAVGLAYDQHLVALAAAGITNSGILSIRQIQDVSGVSRQDGRAHYKTGLYNGFLWRDALVKCWENIGSAIGATTIGVQSHSNSYWELVRSHGKAGYDEVAVRMGYTQSATTKDWLKELS